MFQWFVRHPNWTYFLFLLVISVVLAGVIMIVTEQQTDSFDWPIIIGYMVLFILATVWLIHVKGRSYAWLLLIFLNWIGIIALLCLANKRATPKTISPEGEGDKTA